MPVHAQADDGVLIVTVDGDFTVAELERTVDGALREPGSPELVPALLDLSGSASLVGMKDTELEFCVGVFAARGGRVRRLAVLVSGPFVEDLMRMGTVLMRTPGIRGAPFRAREEAVAWLAGDDPGD